MGPRVKVLCVDDTPEVAAVIGRMLEAAGCDVRVCHGGEAALPVAQEFRPDVGVLDIRMPGMDGNELAVRLREQAGGRPLRCVALTGLWDIGTRHGTHNAGFDEHLVKPVDFRRLIEAVTGRPGSKGAVVRHPCSPGCQTT
jgi:CheY-like chemotaxis protein